MSDMTLLLGSLQPEVFFEQYFQKSLVHIQSRSKNRFSDLFGLADLNVILNYCHLTYPRVRVTDQKNTIHKFDLISDIDRYVNNRNDDIDRARLLRAIAKGGTLVIDKIFELSPKLDDFVDGLRRETGMRFGANGYFTPANMAGVNPHFDRHDVFALQLHGSKTWYYRPDQHDLSKPMRKQQVPAFDDSWSQIDLRVGDVLYLPRGLWHCTRTTQENSLHVAVGCYPLTLSQWLARASQQNHEVADLMESYVSGQSQGGSDALLRQVNALAEILARLAAEQVGCDPPTEHKTLIELD